MQNPIAVISDIHSNFEALTAALDDIRSQGIQHIVCLGDLVGYASGVRSCLKTIRELGCPVVLGNHDEAACLPKPPEDFNDTAAAGFAFAAIELIPAACRRFLSGGGFARDGYRGLWGWLLWRRVPMISCAVV